MKKKLVSTLALSLCFVMSAGTLAGCQFFNRDSSSSSGGDTGSAQDAIYAKVIEAVKATADFNGAFTSTTVQKITRTVNDPEYAEEEQSSSREQSVVGSYDPATNSIYVKQKMVETSTYTYTSEMVGKVFQEDGAYYTYIKTSTSSDREGYEPQTQEQYQGIPAAMVSNAAYKPFSNGEDEDLLDKSVTSVEAYNTAWASYAAESKAEIVAGSTDEESEWYQYTNPEVSYVVSASEVNGTYVVTQKALASILREDTTIALVSETTVTAKEGKILSVVKKANLTQTSYKAKDADGNWEIVPSGTAGAQKVTTVDLQEMTMNVSYEFAKADYDALTTNLPADVETAEEDVRADVDVKMVVNGRDYGVKNIYGYTVAEAIGRLDDSVCQYPMPGIDFAWYTDAACTQAITETMTVEQFNKLDTVYGKATAQTGYVLYTVEETEEFAADVPAAYKTALAGKVGVDNSVYLAACMVEDGLNVHDYGGIAKVNGVEIEFANDSSNFNYSVEAGKTYAVQYIDVCEKAELNIFYYLMG